MHHSLAHTGSSAMSECLLFVSGRLGSGEKGVSGQGPCPPDRQTDTARAQECGLGQRGTPQQRIAAWGPRQGQSTR